jgi:hypothetical protein
VIAFNVTFAGNCSSHLLLLRPHYCCSLARRSTSPSPNPPRLPRSLRHHFARWLAVQAIERMRIEVLENLRHLAAAPGVAFAEVPPDAMLPEYELPDVPAPGEMAGAGGTFLERVGRYALEHGMTRGGELWDDDRDRLGD